MRLVGSLERANELGRIASGREGPRGWAAGLLRATRSRVSLISSSDSARGESPISSSSVTLLCDCSPRSRSPFGGAYASVVWECSYRCICVPRTARPPELLRPPPSRSTLSSGRRPVHGPPGRTRFPSGSPETRRSGGRSATPNLTLLISRPLQGCPRNILVLLSYFD